jgi:hypothetical protein
MFAQVLEDLQADGRDGNEGDQAQQEQRQGGFRPYSEPPIGHRQAPSFVVASIGEKRRWQERMQKNLLRQPARFLGKMDDF